MKKLILMISLMLAMISCGNKGGQDAVQTICDKIVSGELSKVTIDENVLKLDENGRIVEDKSGEVNLFDNEAVRTIIDQNQEYELTKEDKTALTKAIDNSTINTQFAVLPSYGSALTMPEHLPAMIKTTNKTRVLAAKTLGDLL